MNHHPLGQSSINPIGDRTSCLGFGWRRVWSISLFWGFAADAAKIEGRGTSKQGGLIWASVRSQDCAGLNMRNMYPERKPNFPYAGLLPKKGGTPQLSLVERTYWHTVDVQNLVHCDVVLKQFADLRSSAHGKLMIWGGGLGLRVSGIPQ